MRMSLKCSQVVADCVILELAEPARSPSIFPQAFSNRTSSESTDHYVGSTMRHGCCSRLYPCSMRAQGILALRSCTSLAHACAQTGSSHLAWGNLALAVAQACGHSKTACLDFTTELPLIALILLSQYCHKKPPKKTAPCSKTRWSRPSIARGLAGERWELCSSATSKPKLEPCSQWHLKPHAAGQCRSKACAVGPNPASGGEANPLQSPSSLRSRV